MAGRVAFINLGCRVNRVETDLIASSLEKAHIGQAKSEEADCIIVNSCAVTSEAEAKTRKIIRHAAHLEQKPSVIATGCVASLFKDELLTLGDNVYVEADKSKVADLALDLLGVPIGSVSDEGEVISAPTPTGRTRPGIKVQDGCDNRCTFCIVWKARGKARSTSLDEILEITQEALDRGAQEVVLTGINLGRFDGVDQSGNTIGLPGLLEELLTRTQVGRIRLSSIEPPDVTPELLSVMAKYPERIAQFLHICLQSGCDRTLERMARVYTTAEFRKTVELAREMLPNIALGTDLIVGFPGETDEDFEESLAFCREMNFAKMHIFRYSRRPGTPAAEMEGQVDPKVMATRAKRMHELADEMRQSQAKALVGTKQLVVVQTPGKGVTGGLFDAAFDKNIPLDVLVPMEVISVMPKGVLLCKRLDTDGSN